MSEMRTRILIAECQVVEVPHTFSSLLKCTRHVTNVDAGTGTAPYQIRRAICHELRKYTTAVNGHLLKKLCVTTDDQPTAS